MTKTARLLEYLRKHDRISALGALKSLGITDLRKSICELRKIYGFDSFKTGSVLVQSNRGEWFKMPEYTLTKAGRDKIWPVKKTWPEWLSIVKQI
jgi:hypothetical protein